MKTVLHCEADSNLSLCGIDNSDPSVGRRVYLARDESRVNCPKCQKALDAYGVVVRRRRNPDVYVVIHLEENQRNLGCYKTGMEASLAAEKMRQEAESHGEEDRRRMEEVESRNRLDGIVYQAEKTIRESRDKLPETDVKKVEEALEDAKKAMSEGGTARLRSATENVERAMHKIAEELYKTQAAGQAAGAGAGGASSSNSSGGHEQKKPGDVIDAEYVDVDDGKKPN